MKFPKLIQANANFSSQKGITIIEIIITALLFVTVTAAAYKVYVNISKNAISSQKKSNQSRKMTLFLQKLQSQLQNATQLPNSLSTVMQLSVPPDCIDESLYDDVYGWGIIPFPGHDVDLMNTNQSTFNTIDPLDFAAIATPDSSDAVRIVYTDNEAQIYKLALNGAIPYPTIQTTGAETIKIDASSTPNLKVGDFALIADSQKKDLIRITSISNPSTNLYEIGHDPNISSWNLNLIDDYGTQGAGGAFLYKVRVVTYAHDRDRNILMVDDHFADDGFDGVGFTGPLGLALNWQPAISDIHSFQIIYSSLFVESTRTPMAGVPGKTYGSCDTDSTTLPDPYCECENQLGYPGIQNIKMEYTYESSQ